MTLVCAPDALPAGPVRVLRGAELLLPDRCARGDLLIQDTRIAGLAPPGEGRGDETWDVSGTRIAPGFIDPHTHGGWGVDFSTATTAELRELPQRYADVGVTRLLPTLLPAPLDELVDRVTTVARLCKEVPAYLGIHLEGPFLAADRRGALPADGVLPWNEAALARLIDAADGELRVITVAPEVVPVAAIRRLRSLGVMPSIGHTSADAACARTAIAAGAWRATHLCNAMPPLHHRAPGPLLPLIEDDRVRAEVIADGVHLDDELLRWLVGAVGAERLMGVSDSIFLTGQGESRGEFAGAEVSSDGTRASRADGTLAGSVTPLPAALLRGVASGVFGFVELTRLGAVTAAADLGLRRIGRIARGARADLVILESSGAVRATLRGGWRPGQPLPPHGELLAPPCHRLA